MIDSISITSILSLAGIVTAVGGAWLTIRKITDKIDRRKRAEAAVILQTAKEADSQLKAKIESRIHDLEVKIKVMDENHLKDMEHLKETYNGEIKFLGQKIESLREEVRNQHGQLVQLLSKLID